MIYSLLQHLFVPESRSVLFEVKLLAMPKTIATRF